jgi:hypothetical protein
VIGVRWHEPGLDDRPDPHAAVVRGGGEQASVRREVDAEHRAVGSMHDRRGPVGDPPHASEPLEVRGGEQAAVRREAEVVHVVVVQRSPRSAVHVEQHQRPIGRDRHGAAVRAGGDPGAHERRRGGEHPRITAIELPDPDRPRPVTGDDAALVGEQRDLQIPIFRGVEVRSEDHVAVVDRRPAAQRPVGSGADHDPVGVHDQPHDHAVLPAEHSTGSAVPVPQADRPVFPRGHQPAVGHEVDRAHPPRVARQRHARAGRGIPDPGDAVEAEVREPTVGRHREAIDAVLMERHDLRVAVAVAGEPPVGEEADVQRPALVATQDPRPQIRRGPHARPPVHRAGREVAAVGRERGRAVRGDLAGERDEEVGVEVPDAQDTVVADDRQTRVRGGEAEPEGPLGRPRRRELAVRVPFADRQVTVAVDGGEVTAVGGDAEARHAPGQARVGRSQRQILGRCPQVDDEDLPRRRAPRWPRRP